MKGKIVNISIGFLNIFLGILFLLFTIHVPQDKTLLTIQEAFVVKYIRYIIYVILTFISIINFIQLVNYRKVSGFNTAFILSLFAIFFVIIKEPIISAFSFISGIMIIFKSIKENFIEIDNTTIISIIFLIIGAIVITSCLCLFYKQIGETIKNRENKNELSYKSDYFKYVQPLEIDDIYINVKKDGKYGYINTKGETVIDFKYDYASPFVNIEAYDKKFEIALVCENGSTEIILKNERKVLSYRTESNNENYAAKKEELINIYKNILLQEKEFTYEYEEENNNIQKAYAYDESSQDYTYRYDYNNEYDIIVTQSNLGLGDKYELAKKTDLNFRIELETTALDYNENYISLFSNKAIPFYETNSKLQGWFTSYGKKETMEGKAQILDFIDDKILIRDYNKKYNVEGGIIYFIDIKTKSKVVSDRYKDIYIIDNGYIVKNTNDKYQLIDKDFNKMFEGEYDFIDTSLAHKNLYIVSNINDNIEFNDYEFAKPNLTLLNEKGEVLAENIEQIYTKYYTLPDDIKNSKERYSNFLKEFKSIKYEFAGDKFYQEYLNK